MCGLKSKLHVPEFIDFITKYDFIGFNETKITMFDDVSSAFKDIGYDIVHVTRDNCKKASGGIALAVKIPLLPHIRFVNSISGCKNILWFSVSKQLLRSDSLFGIAYIPPENSGYSSLDLFDEISQDLLQLNPKNAKHVCLLGDFNARIGLSVECEVIDNDENEFNEFQDNLFDENIHVQQGFPVTRVSQDIVVNKYGKRIIDLCRSHGLCVLNGRAGQDFEQGGKVTCKGVSVIDLILVSVNMFNQVKDFCVRDFDPLLSDAHCAVEVCFKMHTINDAVNQIKPKVLKGNRPKWGKMQSEKFVIDPYKSECINNDLSYLLENSSQVTQVDINNVCNKVNNLLVNTAASSKCDKAPKRVFKKEKVWYGETCRKARNQYYKYKNKYRNTNSEENRVAMVNASKMYKKTLSKARRNHEKIMLDRLRSLKSSDPRMYWKIINDKGNLKYGDKIVIEDFVEHFSNLNTNNASQANNNVPQPDESTVINEYINRDFTADEISAAIKKLKNNKAPGSDNIINEFIKNSGANMINVYVKLLNLVLHTGIIPEVWTEGLIVPIYKKKGDINDANNYRGITMLSCLSKLLTSCINERLSEYVNEADILGEDQAGFRNGYSTADHIFSLKALIDLFLFQKKRLYAAFVDYQKAFDSVQRNLLWVKLLSYNINGNLLNVVRNLYKNAKSCIMINNVKSDYFNCSVGVRQGENLSPLLFALFINDMSDYLSKYYTGINNTADLATVFCKDHAYEAYFKIFLLLYADDTVLLSESINDLQGALTGLHAYCKDWGLTVNTSKTKVVVFSRGKIRNLPSFYYAGEPIEVLPDYMYLGIVFNYNGRFNKAIINLTERANKAMFALLTKIKTFSLPVDMSIELFDHLVLPILTYGSEVWGFENVQVIEKVHLKFLKLLLRLKPSTCSDMIYGEVGRLPLVCYIKARMLSYWANMLISKECKLNKLLYTLLLKMHKQNVYTSPWIMSVNKTLDECGMSNIWLSQSVPNIKWFKLAIKQKLADLCMQEWHSRLLQHSSCVSYIMFKSSFNCEKYLTSLSTIKRVYLCKFRLRNFKLPVVTCKYENHDNMCNLCGDGIGDESHYLFICPALTSLRQTLITPHLIKKAYLPLPVKLQSLLSTTDPVTLTDLCYYIKSLSKLL